jgi:hypothetical protein
MLPEDYVGHSIWESGSMIRQKKVLSHSSLLTSGDIVFIEVYRTIQNKKQDTEMK